MGDGRIYDTTAWQKLRRLKLDVDPVCEDCAAMGRVRIAVAVDHRIAVSQGGEPFPALDGLASLCTPCHSAKTVRGDEAGAWRTSKPRRGCHPDGTPIDPRHPWAAGNLSGLTLPDHRPLREDS